MKKTLVLYFTLLVSNILVASETDALWEKRKAAQIEWHNDLAILLRKEIPKAEEVILIQRDLQINIVHITNELYYYLLRHHPTRIVRNQGQSRWANFEKTGDIKESLWKTSKHYRDLLDANKVLLEKSRNHPIESDFRDAFKKIRDEQEYKVIEKKLIKIFDEIDNKLKVEPTN